MPGVLPRHRLLECLHLRFDLVSIRRRHLLAQVTQRFFGLVDRLVGLVAGLDGLPAAIVLGRAALGVLHHALDIGLVQVGAGRDGDLLFAAGGLVFGCGVQDAVGIQIERDLDLRRSSRRGWKAIQPERAQGHVVGRHRALALQHENVHRGLGVRRRAKHFALAGRDRRVAWDERRHHTAQRLHAKRKRRHVEQQYILSTSSDSPSKLHFIFLD